MRIKFEQRFSTNYGGGHNPNNITIGEYLGEVLGKIGEVSDALIPLAALYRIADALEKHNELTAQTNTRLAWIEEELEATRKDKPRDSAKTKRESERRRLDAGHGEIVDGAICIADGETGV
jgi:hypothetical protein